jgi:tRNA(Ile)-lysidine synthase
MIRRLGQELLEEGLIEKDDRVVVAVSGGPDSMALLHLLRELNGTLDWSLRLDVAHLNHRIRGEDADEDAAFVQAAADGLQLPCTVETRDIPAMASERGLAVEETGRQERYAFFGRVALQTGSNVVALAHHADDNAETILHRIIRGTGLRGLSGIPHSRALSASSGVRIIRPLLRWRRAQIMEYVNNSGIAYRDDATNASDEIMRNRIRNRVLPMLEQDINPQAREALIRLGEQAEWLEEFLRETVQRTFETLIISRNDRELVLNADALARKSRIVQAELVRLGYRSLGLGEQDLSFAHLVSVLDLIADPASGKQAVLPNGLTLQKRYHQLTFSLPIEESRETIAPEIAVNLPGVTVLPIRRLEIECAIQEVTEKDIPDLRRAATRLEEYIDFEAVRPPLVVRKRRPGDRFFPLGAPGSKKLSDFLTSTKVDPREREKIAVLCDHLGPIWIIGHRIDDRVKMTALTRRVLRLKARAI